MPLCIKNHPASFVEVAHKLAAQAPFMWLPYLHYPTAHLAPRLAPSLRAVGNGGLSRWEKIPSCRGAGPRPNLELFLEIQKGGETTCPIQEVKYRQAIKTQGHQAVTE